MKTDADEVTAWYERSKATLRDIVATMPIVGSADDRKAYGDLIIAATMIDSYAHFSAVGMDGMLSILMPDDRIRATVMETVQGALRLDEGVLAMDADVREFREKWGRP